MFATPSSEQHGMSDTDTATAVGTAVVVPQWTTGSMVLPVAIDPYGNAWLTIAGTTVAQPLPVPLPEAALPAHQEDEPAPQKCATQSQAKIFVHKSDGTLEHVAECNPGSSGDVEVQVLDRFHDNNPLSSDLDELETSDEYPGPDSNLPACCHDSLSKADDGSFDTWNDSWSPPGHSSDSSGGWYDGCHVKGGAGSGTSSIASSTDFPSLGWRDWPDLPVTGTGKDRQGSRPSAGVPVEPPIARSSKVPTCRSAGKAVLQGPTVATIAARASRANPTAVAKGDDHREPEGLPDVCLKQAAGLRNSCPDSGHPSSAKQQLDTKLSKQRFYLSEAPQEAPPPPPIEVPRSRQRRKAQRSIADATTNSVAQTGVSDPSTSQTVEGQGNACSAHPKQRLQQGVVVDTQMVPHGDRGVTAHVASVVTDAAPPTGNNSELRLPALRRRHRQPNPFDKRQCNVRVAESQRAIDKRRKRAQREENMTTVHEQPWWKLILQVMLAGAAGVLIAFVMDFVMALAVTYSTKETMTETMPETSEYVEQPRTRAFVFRSAHAWSTAHPQQRRNVGQKKIGPRLQRLEFEIEYALTTARGQLGGLSPADPFPRWLAAL